MDDSHGVEVLMSEDGKLSIDQCKAVAVQFSIDGKGCTFDLCGPKGSRQATWLDPRLELFTLEGGDGFLMVAQFRFTKVWCKNILPVEKG